MAKVAIIGAGISGLYSAYLVAKAGHEVTIFESSDHTGGAIASRKFGVAPNENFFDVGAEAFSIVRPETLDLVTELESDFLLVEPRRSDARLIVNGEKFVLPAGILGVPADLEDADLLSLIGRDALSEARELDALPWPVELDSPSVSLGELVERRLGTQVVAKSVAPIIAGVHASDPYLLEADSVAPGLRAAASRLGSLSAAARELRARSSRPGANIASLLGGMTTLVFTLEQVLRELGVEIQLKQRVESLDNLDDFEYAVFAIAPGAAAKIYGLPSEITETLAKLHTVDVALCILLVESEQLNSEPLGSGALVAPNAVDVSAKATTHVNAKWQWVSDALQQAQKPNQHLIRLSYGRNGLLPDLDESLIETALVDLAKLYSVSDAKLIQAEIVYWPQTLVQAKSGHSENLAKLAESVSKHHGSKNLKGFTFVGAGLGGNGITGILSQTSKAISKLGLV